MSCKCVEWVLKRKADGVSQNSVIFVGEENYVIDKSDKWAMHLHKEYGDSEPFELGHDWRNKIDKIFSVHIPGIIYDLSIMPYHLSTSEQCFSHQECIYIHDFLLAPVHELEGEKAQDIIDELHALTDNKVRVCKMIPDGLTIGVTGVHSTFILYRYTDKIIKHI